MPHGCPKKILTSIFSTQDYSANYQNINPCLQKVKASNSKNGGVKRDLGWLTMDFSRLKRDLAKTDTAVRVDAAVCVSRCSRKCEPTQP